VLSDDSFDPLADRTVSVTTTDDDVAGFSIVESGGGTTVAEAAGTDDFTVVLDRQPMSSVVFDVSSADLGEATVAPLTLIFLPGNWSTPQTVTVTGVNDDIDDGDRNTLITVSIDAPNSDDAFDPLPSRTVSATTVDDDVSGFTIVESAGSTDVTEAGGTDDFTVVLDSEPTSSVVIAVTSGDTGEATVLPDTLTFTPADWNTPQSVTVTGVDDDLIDGDVVTTITLSIDPTASDNSYDPLADQTVSVTTADDDVAGFTVTETGGTTVSEGGTTDNFTVVLDAQPVTNVVFTVVSGDVGEATVAPATLTFQPADWNVPQTVTVTGVDDFAPDGDQITTVTIAIDAASSDNDFDPLAPQTVTVTTLDDDGAGFTISESGGGTTVTEAGGTDDFTVVLNAQPTNDVVLTISSGDVGEATVSPTTLTFTNATWSSPQAVTVTGVDDLIDDGLQFTSLTVSVDVANSDAAYGSVPDQIVTATTTDDDVAGFTNTPSGGGTLVTEAGSTDDFTVVLTAQPVSDVVLLVTSGDP
jgi:hypothetical protein